MSEPRPISGLEVDKDERRQSGRVEASLECTLASEVATVEAQVQNLSRTGAGLLAEPGAATVGALVSLLLERAEGMFSLGLSATVVRAMPRGERFFYGLRFEPMPPDLERELLMLLKTLAAGRGGGQRQHARVAARIDVHCRSRERFEATLKDLSLGGMSVRCPRALNLGDELEVNFGIEGHQKLFVVRGQVLRCSLDGERFLVGIKFPPPSDAQRADVLRLLDALLSLGPRQAMVIDDDDD